MGLKELIFETVMPKSVKVFREVKETDKKDFHLDHHDGLDSTIVCYTDENVYEVVINSYDLQEMYGYDFLHIDDATFREIKCDKNFLKAAFIEKIKTAKEIEP